MAITRWIWFVILLLVVYFVLAPWLGLSKSLWLTLAFAFALGLTLDYFGIFRIFPFRLKKNIALILLIVLWGYTAWTAGWLSGLIKLPGAAIPGVPTVTPPATTQTTCAASVSDEIRGLAAILPVNAWDLESNTPYASAVDFTTNCYIYKNGNGPTDYVSTSNDTSAATLSNMFSIGDTVYMYCGGSTYYGEPVEGLCVNSASTPVNINAHRIVSETDLQITGYDSTGSATLTAGTAAQASADYTFAMGANADESIFVKLKVNVANKAYQFCGWGTFTFYNISKVEPQNEESTYTKIATPLHMQGLNVDFNATSGQSMYGDYTLYKASSPILLHEWDSIKEQFIVTSHSSNDPQGTTLSGTDFDGFAILAKDCAYARGNDGRMYLDIYQHDTAEGDVGLDETETSPQGKYSGMTVAVT